MRPWLCWWGWAFPKPKRFGGALSFIVLFTALTGFQVSTVRAASLGGLFLVGQWLGRKRASYRALVFVAMVMLLFNPLLLKRSVGFQLSFFSGSRNHVALVPLLKAT